MEIIVVMDTFTLFHFLYINHFSRLKSCHLMKSLNNSQNILLSLIILFFYYFEKIGATSEESKLFPRGSFSGNSLNVTEPLNAFLEQVQSQSQSQSQSDTQLPHDNQLDTFSTGAYSQFDPPSSQSGLISYAGPYSAPVTNSNSHQNIPQNNNVNFNDPTRTINFPSNQNQNQNQQQPPFGYPQNQYRPTIDAALQQLLNSFNTNPENQRQSFEFGQPQRQQHMLMNGMSTAITVSYVTCYVGCSHVTNIVSSNSGATSTYNSNFNTLFPSLGLIILFFLAF